MSFLHNPQGVPEAPIDGDQYGRKDGGWEKITQPTGQLLAENNLSDLDDLQESRDNLEVYSKNEVDGLIPDISGKENSSNKDGNIIGNKTSTTKYPTIKAVFDWVSGLISTINTNLGNKEDKSNKGIANGYASLDGNAKVPLSQINDALLGNVAYQGTWNANTNTPTLPTASTSKGKYWVTSVAGTYNSIFYEVGDWVISNGTIYEKVDNTDAVSSVAGKTGVVTLVKGDVGLGNVDNTSDVNKPISTATQSALDGKQATITGGASTITASNLTANRVLTSDGSGKVAVATTTATELGYVSGVTSAIQTQLNAKADDSAVVKLTGSQTIAGTKTFSTIPVAPASDPTTDNELARKLYVDSKIPKQTSVPTFGSHFNLTLSHNWLTYATSGTNGRNVNIPTNASQAFPIGSQIDFIQTNTGSMLFSPESGVTLNSKSGNRRSQQNCGYTLKKTDTDTWFLFGDLVT